MQLPTVIGIYSPAPGCGKTTIAKYLLTRGYRTVSFAEPLKAMTTQLLLSFGYTVDTARALVRERKHERLPALGVDSRHLLRTLGTEWGRDCVHPEIWLRAWRYRTDTLLAQGHNVVCDDMRFLNEATLLRNYPNSRLWRIERDSSEPASSHRSDGGLNDYPEFDAVIQNNSSIVDLYDAIEQHLVADHALAS